MLKMEKNYKKFEIKFRIISNNFLDLNTFFFLIYEQIKPYINDKIIFIINIIMNILL